MTRHGKNNTASSVFTHAERMMTGNGSKKQRFTSHSMADFDSCRLCLNTARDPRVDSFGHLFCHECILEHILSQKKDLKRQKALLEKLNLEEEHQRQKILKSVRARVIEDFERNQSGITTSTTTTSSSSSSSNNNNFSSNESSIDPNLIKALKSNLFSPSSSSQLDQLTTKAERLALEAIEKEAVEAKKSKLPNFWLPSLTPSAPPTRPSNSSSNLSKNNYGSVSLKPLCNVSNRSGSNRAHPIKLNDLVTVQFNLDNSNSNDSSKSKIKTCSGCCKTLNKNSQLVVLKPCGDVICLNCFKTLILNNQASVELTEKQKQKGEEKMKVDAIQKDQKEKDQDQQLCPKCEKIVNDHIKLEREGTGFAAGGIAEATKFDVAFQG